MSIKSLTLVYENGNAGFPRCRCDAGSPHNDKEFVDDLQNLKCEHFEQFFTKYVLVQQHGHLRRSIAGDHDLLVIPSGVGGVFYNPHTLVPLKSLGLDSQRVKKLALKLHAH